MKLAKSENYRIKTGKWFVEYKKKLVGIVHSHHLHHSIATHVQNGGLMLVREDGNHFRIGDTTCDFICHSI